MVRGPLLAGRTAFAARKCDTPLATQSEVEADSADTPEEQMIPPVASSVEKQNVQLATVAEEEPEQRGISGMVVLKQTEDPIAGVEVDLVERGERKAYPPGTKFETGSDGTFEFPEVDPRSLFPLRLGWPYRYTTDSFTSTVWADRAQDFFVLEAREQGAVTGYVRYPDGSPVHGAEILRTFPFGNRSLGLSESDENGRFGFSHDGGTWRIQAAGTMNLDPESVVLELLQGEIVECDFILPYAAAIHLTVIKPNGDPPDFIDRVSIDFEKAIRMEERDSRPFRMSAGRDSFQRNGKVFTLPILASGDYTITLDTPGFEAAVVGPITIPQSLDDQYASVTLVPKVEEAMSENDSTMLASQPQLKEPTTIPIAVHIQDESGNSLDAHMSLVYIVDEWGMPWSNSGYMYSALQILPGTYWFIAVKDGYTADMQYLSISERSKEITFTLPSLTTSLRQFLANN